MVHLRRTRGARQYQAAPATTARSYRSSTEVEANRSTSAGSLRPASGSTSQRTRSRAARTSRQGRVPSRPVATHPAAPNRHHSWTTSSCRARSCVPASRCARRGAAAKRDRATSGRLPAGQRPVAASPPRSDPCPSTHPTSSSGPPRRPSRLRRKCRTREGTHRTASGVLHWVRERSRPCARQQVNDASAPVASVPCQPRRRGRQGPVLSRPWQAARSTPIWASQVHTSQLASRLSAQVITMSSVSQSSSTNGCSS
jgi:hypothetical protein